MEIQTLDIATIKQVTRLELPAFRLKTSTAVFDIREEPDGSLHLRAFDKLVIVAVDGSSAKIVAAPFDDRWIAGVNGKEFTE